MKQGSSSWTLNVAIPFIPPSSPLRLLSTLPSSPFYIPCTPKPSSWTLNVAIPFIPPSSPLHLISTLPSSPFYIPCTPKPSSWTLNGEKCTLKPSSWTLNGEKCTPKPSSWTLNGETPKQKSDLVKCFIEHQYQDLLRKCHSVMRSFNNEMIAFFVAFSLFVHRNCASHSSFLLSLYLRRHPSHISCNIQFIRHSRHLGQTPAALFARDSTRCTCA